MKRVLLAACAMAMGAVSPASAQLWGATADGDYFNLAGTPGFDVNLAVNVPLNWDQISLQLNVGDHAAGPDHDFGTGANIIWNDPDNQFRFAVSGIYNHDVLGPLRLNETQAGVGGEWYPTDWLTLGARGGGILGQANGGYAGGALKVYAFDDFTLAGTIDYTGVSYHSIDIHETDYGVTGEWLISETFPLAVTTSFVRSHFDAGGFFAGSTNTVSVGFKFYVNEFGAGPLAQRDRTGTLDTIGPIHPVLLSSY